MGTLTFKFYPWHRIFYVAQNALLESKQTQSLKIRLNAIIRLITQAKKAILFISQKVECCIVAGGKGVGRYDEGECARMWR